MNTKKLATILRIRQLASTCLRYSSTSESSSTTTSNAVVGDAAIRELSSSSADSSIVERGFVPRDRFKLPTNFQKIHWYPPHMQIQMKRMEGKLRTVDLIVEVHDARVALTGRNTIFGEKLYLMRPHILVLNKMDLIDLHKYKTAIEDYHYERGVRNIVWTNCKKGTPKALNDLRTRMLECLRQEHRFNRTVKTEYQAMVVGIPNVGKSSLINALRTHNLGITRNAVAEGSRPGVTIRVQNRVRLLDKPLTYVLDTPGVLNPHFKDVEGAMKLAACNLIMESATKPLFVADFLLYYMNKHGDYSYLRWFDMPGGPTNDLRRVLLHICQTKNLRLSTYIGTLPVERWNFDSAVEVFMGAFRRGQAANSFLDRDILEKEN